MDDELKKASELSTDDLLAKLARAKPARVWRRPRPARVVEHPQMTAVTHGMQVGWWKNEGPDTHARVGKPESVKAS